jgi:hypothetical protein
MNTTGGTPGDLDVTHELVTAATVAAQAPSILNTQPWKWRIHAGLADLYADTRRQLPVIDGDGRLLTISCGAALHLARLALAAHGAAAEITLTPTPQDPFHLARVSISGRVQADDASRRQYEAIPHRHTDRSPLLDEPVAADAIAEFKRLVGEFSTWLHPLSRNEVLDLATATVQAQSDQLSDVATVRELDAWGGAHRPPGAGIPDTDIPAVYAHTSVPAPDLGHVDSLPVNDRYDDAAIYAILVGPDDRSAGWIRAGEALSAMWLCATERRIAVLPLAAAVEELATRQSLHRTLAGKGYAHLAVRLGIADPDQPGTPRTVRMPASATIKVFA